MPEDSRQAGALSQDFEITKAALARAANVLIQSGALAEPTFGVAVLAEQVLRAALEPPDPAGRARSLPPSKIALRLDRYL